MDFSRAIAKIDPRATYLLNHSQADGLQEIVEWRGPGRQPTEKELDDAWLLCLQDDADNLQKELDRQQAISRVKLDPALSDLVLVLDL